MSYTINGKGDTYRPVDNKKWDSNYDNIKWKSKKDTDQKSKVKNNIESVNSK